MATVILIANMSLLAVVSDVWAHQSVWDCLGLFSVLHSYLCLAFRDITTVSTTNHTVPHANVVARSRQIALLSRSPVLSLSLRECNTLAYVGPSLSRYFSRARNIDCNNMNVPIDANVQHKINIQNFGWE